MAVALKDMQPQLLLLSLVVVGGVTTGFANCVQSIELSPIFGCEAGNQIKVAFCPGFLPEPGNQSVTESVLMVMRRLSLTRENQTYVEQPRSVISFHSGPDCWHVM